MKCSLCSSKNCLISKYCSEDSIEQFFHKKSCVEYPKRQQIIKEGTLVTGVYFILSGAVKVIKEGLNGRNQIIRIAKSGDILGHRGYRDDMTYPISAVSLEKTRVCFIEYEAFNALLQLNPQFTINLLHLYADELTNVEARLRNMAQMSVREKVAESLIWIFNIVSTDSYGGLNITLSRQEIAEIAGTNADQVSRELTSLIKEGIILSKGKQIIIKDFDKLKGIIKSYDYMYV